MPEGNSVTNSGSRLSGLDPAKVEEVFLSVPDPQSAQSVSIPWTSEPHLAGSQNDYNSALELLHAFQSHFGIHSSEPLPVYDAGTPESRNAILGISELEQPKVWIDTYYPLLETPGERKLELLGDEDEVIWSADLEEGDAIGAWHAWSKSGDVKGKIIYANYGFDFDLEELKKAGKEVRSHKDPPDLYAGHDVAGSIVLIREGHTFRGLRIKQLAEAGAAGCLTFKHPRDEEPINILNGYKPWPEGPARNPHAITRGHAMDISMKSGDPTTPGYPSYRDAPRVEPNSFPSIPSLPISWSNAEVLLKEMERSGGKASEREVRLVNQTHRKIGPIWNVMAAIPGHIRDEVVIAGNHRDAWVFGASDPTSGTVSLHEMSKGLGELLRRGWKPLRTILLASWDGEEFGLFGSTEWAEDFRDWLKEHAVAYINVDKSSSGRQLRIRGTPTIAPLLRQAALDLPHYEDSDRTLWDARGDLGLLIGSTKPAQPAHLTQDMALPHSTGIRTLGSGSDYTVFLQQLGITCGDLAFTTTTGDAAYHYHSFYDSEDWMDRYGDPGFLRRVAIAKYWGLVLLRLADSFILPLDTTQYALELDDYLDKVALLLPSLPGAPEITQLREAIKKVQEASNALDLHKAQVHARLHDHIKHAKDNSEQDPQLSVQRAFGSFSSGQPGTSELNELFKDIHSINKKLSGFERGFISEAGLPGREWYRHMIVAPGKWVGYGATTFPSLTEAINLARNSNLAAQQVERLTQLLHTLAEFLNQRASSDEQLHQSQPLLAL